MNLIEQIKADREAGTPGPWRRGQDGNPRVYGPDGSGIHSGLLMSEAGDVFKGPANARRIARVPDIEAALLDAEPALLAAEELAKSADAAFNAIEFMEGLGNSRVSVDLRAALAAYRKATGAAQ